MLSQKDINVTCRCQCRCKVCTSKIHNIVAVKKQLSSRLLDSHLTWCFILSGLSFSLSFYLSLYQHEKPVKTCHWIQAPNYSCLMTGSWDNTIKFWDTRSQNPIAVLQIPERVYCADVVYPMAIVGTAQRGIICYQLENQPSEVKRLESPLKYQVHVCFKYNQMISLDSSTFLRRLCLLVTLLTGVRLMFLKNFHSLDNVVLKRTQCRLSLFMQEDQYEYSPHGTLCISYGIN